MTEHLPLVLDGIGVLFLLLSLIPIRKVINQSSHRTRTWKVALCLTLFFIMGYSYLAIHVFINKITINNLFFSVILFTGSIFVLLVSRISVASVQKERMIAETERYRALHDELTRLPNRTFLHECIEHHIKLAKRKAEQFTILLMDLNQFKDINDTLGHQWGDNVLKQLAQRLTASVRDSDVISRLGGDEFGVVLPTTTSEEALSVTEKISTALEQPFVVDNHEVSLGISIGIATFPQHGFECATLLQRAEVAMYNAKESSKNHSIYDIAIDNNTIDQLTLSNQLREAIQKDQFELYYMPKVDIKNRKVCGLEALLRWNHPTRGIVRPDDFLPTAEKAGLINPLTLWVLSAALKQIKEWQEYWIELPVAINISVKNLQHQDFPSKMIKLIQDSAIQPQLIILEITETNMMVEPELTQKVMAKLDDIGVMFSIDDFGTGYSSLSYLKKLPAMEIKIDKSFVMDMIEDENDAVIVRSTIDMSHNMGRKVTAEGVATQEIYDVLEILRCDLGQGNYFCCPLPANELVRWLANTPWNKHAKIRQPIPPSFSAQETYASQF